MACLERRLEGLEAAFDRAAGRQIEQLLLRAFDLVDGGFVEVGLEGVVDHVFAERDQLAAQEQIVDQPTVIAGVDDRDHAAGEARQVLHAAGGNHQFVALEIGLQRDRIGLMALFDQLDDRGVDARVHRVAEVLGRQIIRDALKGAVVHEDRAQQARAPLRQF